MANAHHLCLVVTAALTPGCMGTRHLDPPPPPARTIPNLTVPQTPLEPGMARVIVDVTDGPAELQLKTHQPQGGWLPMCRTPCVIDMPTGLNEASFRIDADHSGDYTQIFTPPGTSVYRRTLVERSGSPELAVAGSLTAYAGFVTVLSGLVISAFDTGGHSGRNTMLFGVGLSILGGALFYSGWPTERPAATTQFGLSP